MNMSPSHHRTPEQGHADPSRAAGDHAGQDGHDHEAMIADFRRRFWISLALTVPILPLSPMIQRFLGLDETLAFPGDVYVLFGLASVVYFWGGWPFLKGIARELTARRPGMMTLIALAISVAYFYSSAVVFGLAGEPFFWELATLIDVMLLGHWIEMRSVMGARPADAAAARARARGPRIAECGRPVWRRCRRRKKQAGRSRRRAAGWR
jgi:Cu2+-exporting ATPase